jgi:hypothetical protein
MYPYRIADISRHFIMLPVGIMANLTPRQLAFVREYCIDRNGTQAAIRAGYSPKTAQEQSSRLLSNVMVREAVDAKLDRLAAKTETEAEWVRRRLKQEADDFSEGATQAGRVRALELLGKINGIFEANNKQRAGIFDEIPTSTLTFIQEKLREIVPGGGRTFQH